MRANRRKNRVVAIFPGFVPYRKEKEAVMDLRVILSRLAGMRGRKDPLYNGCAELHRFCADRMSKTSGKITLRLVACRTVEDDDGEEIDIFQAVYNDGTRLHIFRVSEKCLAGRRKESIRKKAENSLRLFCLLPIFQQPIVYAVR